MFFVVVCQVFLLRSFEGVFVLVRFGVASSLLHGPLNCDDKSGIVLMMGEGRERSIN